MGVTPFTDSPGHCCARWREVLTHLCLPEIGERPENYSIGRIYAYCYIEGDTVNWVPPHGPDRCADTWSDSRRR